MKPLISFQYIKFADEIEEKIENGSFKAGEKLPSLRTLHTRTGLSISTVYQSYIELEKRGMVEARQKSGFFVMPLLKNILPLPKIKKHKPRPKKVVINALIDSVLAAVNNTDILLPGPAIPSPDLLPLKQLSR